MPISMKPLKALILGAACLGGLSMMPSSKAVAAWKPTHPVELIVPAGIGGGAGQMAQLIQGIVQKHNLMPTSIVVISKKGGSGAEGFLYVKNAKADPHKLIITLSNLFTTPLATGSPFSWKDYTPVAMMALDEFVLWVNAKTPYRSPNEYIEAVKKTGGKMKMGGTGSKQEDQIITAALEQKTGAKFTYVPYSGGGTVCTQLVGGHIDSSVNNPVECVAHWRAGNVRPLCVFELQADALSRQDHRGYVVARHSNLQVEGPRHRIHDAARHHGNARRTEGSGRLLYRPAQEGTGDAGMESLYGKRRLQSELHDRCRVQQVADGCRGRASQVDGKGRVPSQGLVIPFVVGAP